TTSSQSAVGSRSFTFTNTTTLKAFARDAAGNNSATITHTYTVNDTQAPTLTFNPAGGTFTGTVSLTLSATDNRGTPTIYYTTDGSTPTTSSPSASGSVTLSITSTRTVRAFARDAAGNSSAIAAHTYTINPSTGGFTVYFKRPSNWTTTPRIHYWNAQPAGSLASTTWPGVTMTEDTNGWWRFTFPANVTGINLLFHSGTGVQTPDLYRNKTGWYRDGVWYDTNPDNLAGFKVFFKPSGYTNPNIYYWNVQPAGVMPSVTWPGPKMTATSNGWFEFMFTGASCTNLIFSNNGASQTADLYRCGVGWYTNGTWSNTPPSGAPTSRETEEDLLVEEDLDLLLQNYPNPFRAMTTFQFSLSERSAVTLKIYNLTGAEVATVVEEELQPGMHLVEWNAGSLQEGIYLYRLTTVEGTQTKRLMISR
ncbi:MAG: starch-binding protein, partial [Flammeovirgaceae bacterium]|nr:starch-binding protein [Flammeovirgaceae bacterium]MDW8287652.1 starch-binding protein [Flammeovirgaceae bacterium]